MQLTLCSTNEYDYNDCNSMLNKKVHYQIDNALTINIDETESIKEQQIPTIPVLCKILKYHLISCPYIQFNVHIFNLMSIYLIHIFNMYYVCIWLYAD